MGRFSHPVLQLNQSAVIINKGAAVIEGVASNSTSGSLCSQFLVRAKVSPCSICCIKRLLIISGAHLTFTSPRHVHRVGLPGVWQTVRIWHLGHQKERC